MNFLNPDILWLLLLVPPLLLLTYWRSGTLRQRMLGRFAAGRLIERLMDSYSPRLQNLKYALLVLAMALGLLALARPQWGIEMRQQRSRGIDILFALDASKSMLAPDVSPSRLTRARLAMLDLLGQLEGDRVGLIAFSGNAFLQCPLTLDYDAFRQSLDVVRPGLIARGGSDLAAAIEEASEAFEEGQRDKFLVLISDGEDLSESGTQAARQAGDAGITIFTVGVGTTEGSRIPITDRFNRDSFVTDPTGAPVVTRLDEATLRAISEATGGFYTPLGTTGGGLERIYYRGMNAAQRQERETTMEPVPIERFQYFLIPAVLCLMVEMLLTNRRRRPQTTSPAVLPLGIALALAMLAMPGNLQAQEEAEADAPAASADSPDPFVLYQLGKYGEAALGYKARSEAAKTPEAETLYNLGTALHKRGAYREAVRAFSDALEIAPLDLQQRTFYNLGNTHFKMGEAQLTEDPAQTIEQWDQAIQHFDSALELDPDDAEARYNRDKLQSMRDALQQMQDQQPPSGGEGENQENQQQQDSDQQDGEQQEQGENGQPQQPQEGQEGDPQNQQQGEEQQSQDDPQARPEQGEDGRRPLEERELQGANEALEEMQESAEEDPSGEPSNAIRMSESEARQLLEALRQRERQLPLAETPEEAARARAQPNRDW